MNKNFILIFLAFFLVLTIVQAQPFSYWKFDEGSATNLIDTMNRDNGTLTGSGVIYGAGKYNTGLLFNATNGYGYLHTAPLNNTRNFTISTWINSKGGATQNVYSEGTTRLMFQGNSGSGYVQFLYYDGSTSTIISSNDAMIPNTWYYLNAVANGTETYIYINGVKQAEIGAITGNEISLLIGRIGTSYVGNNWFNGTIDELRIYNYSLTQSEILSLYNSNLDPNVNVTLVSPTNDTIVTTPQQTFSCNASAMYLINNIILDVWNSNGTFVHEENKSVTPAYTVSESFNYVLPYADTFQWDCRAYDENGRHNWGSLGSYNIIYEPKKVYLSDPPDGWSTSILENQSFVCSVDSWEDTANVTFKIWGGGVLLYESPAQYKDISNDSVYLYKSNLPWSSDFFAAENSIYLFNGAPITNKYNKVTGKLISTINVTNIQSETDFNVFAGISIDDTYIYYHVRFGAGPYSFKIYKYYQNGTYVMNGTTATPSQGTDFFNDGNYFYKMHCGGGIGPPSQYVWKINMNNFSDYSKIYHDGNCNNDGIQTSMFNEFWGNLGSGSGFRNYVWDFNWTNSNTYYDINCGLPSYIFSGGSAHDGFDSYNGMIYSYNGKKCITQKAFIFNYSLPNLGTYEWNCEKTDSLGSKVSADENSTIIVTPPSVINDTFYNETLELSTYLYTATVENPGNGVIVQPHFWYGDKDYTKGITNVTTTENITFTLNFNIPRVGDLYGLWEDRTYNGWWFWIYYPGNPIPEIVFGTLYDQRVHKMALNQQASCSGNYTIPFYWINYKDELLESPLTIVNNTWNLQMINLDNKTFQRNYNSTSNGTSHNWCAHYTTTEHYFITAALTSEVERINYSLRKDFICEKTNTSFINKTLYLLKNTSDYQKFFFHVKDINQLDFANVYLYFEKWQSNQWLYVASEKTDEYGTAVSRLIEDKDYKISIYDENCTLLKVFLLTLTCETLPCDISLLTSEVTQPLEPMPELEGFYYTMQWDPLTNMFYLSYEDVNDVSSSVEMIVSKKNFNIENTIICDQTSTNSSNVMSCNLSNYTDGDFEGKMIVTVNDGSTFERISTWKISSSKQIFGTEMLFWALLVILALFFVGIWNPVVALCMAGLGLFFFIFFGLIALSLVSIVVIALLIGLYIYKSRS